MYTPPVATTPAPAVDAKALQARAATLELELSRQRARFEALLSEAEVARKKLVDAERTAVTSQAELARLKAEGEQAAKVLSFNERETRRKLIDVLLLDAGWKVGENGKSTDQVGQEVLLEKVPEEGGGDVAQVQGGLQVTRARDPHPLRLPYLRVANVYRDRLDLSEIKEIRVTESEYDRCRLEGDGPRVIVRARGREHCLAGKSLFSFDSCLNLVLGDRASCGAVHVISSTWATV